LTSDFCISRFASVVEVQAKITILSRGKITELTAWEVDRPKCPGLETPVCEFYVAFEAQLSAYTVYKRVVWSR